MKYTEYRAHHADMVKNAGGWGDFTQALGELPSTIMEVLKNGSIILLAGSGLIGGGVGYGIAKMTAHGKQDLDTVKKEYENERLKADLGYLTAKTRSEFDAYKTKQAPVSARVIN